jgi:hypothetical protein
VSQQNENVLFEQSRNVLFDRVESGGADQGQLLMNQAERDRLDALKRAKKKLITGWHWASSGMCTAPKSSARRDECGIASRFLWKVQR